MNEKFKRVYSKYNLLQNALLFESLGSVICFFLKKIQQGCFIQ